MGWEEDLCGFSICSDVMELLDQNWFFQRSFRRARMVKSLMVASSSSPIIVDKPVDKSLSTNHIPKDDTPPTLRPQPTLSSLPLHLEWENHQGKVGSSCGSVHSISRPADHPLHTPSPCSENFPYSHRGSAVQVPINPMPWPSSLPNKAQAMDGKIKNHGSMHRQSTCARRVKKHRSCKSLSDLEFEEVQGFMDLGFIFNKESLNSHVLNVVPGLQRLGEEDEMMVLDNINGSKVNRPYLSEAWLVHRRDSPILSWNMSCPKRQVDMKKHLRFWARAVASSLLLEC